VEDAVLDASVVLKWFRDEDEHHVRAARALRAAFESGELFVFAPPLLHLEIINVAGRRWRLDEAKLVELARSLDELGFELVEPELERVAHWTARGLSSYDAAYVALAESERIELITDDALILATATGIAVALDPTNC
jgi:predicted nucleic acid-binding protein